MSSSRDALYHRAITRECDLDHNAEASASLEREWTSAERHSSWLLALGSWLLALGSWLLALGSWLLAGSQLVARRSFIPTLPSPLLRRRTRPWDSLRPPKPSTLQPEDARG